MLSGYVFQISAINARVYVRIKVYKAFSHDVMVAILVFQNNETAAMLVCLENPLGAELFSLVNTFSCSNKLA